MIHWKVVVGFLSDINGIFTRIKLTYLYFADSCNNLQYKKIQTKYSGINAQVIKRNLCYGTKAKL